MREIKPERQFRLFSVALLGLVALACVPERPLFTSHALNADKASLAPAKVEIDSLGEVEQINAGQFKPYVRGESSLIK